MTVVAAHRSDLMFQVLHVVRLRGRTPSEAVAASLGDGVDADALLGEAAAADHVVHRDGRARGWSLTPAGREVHDELLAAERDAAQWAGAVGAAYERFLALNPQLLQVCTDWQVGPDGSLNAHDDHAYDRRIVDALLAIDAQVQPVCRDLADALVRCSSYGRRLAAAASSIEAGDARFFTSPAVESYHTIWFELHEDLLQTLAIERAEGR